MRTATDEVPAHLLTRYLRGGCFVLAGEMHRRTGLPLLGLRDGAGRLHHAVVADPEPGFGWDIRGRVPLDRAGDGCSVKDLRIEPIGLSDLEAAGNLEPLDMLEAARVLHDVLAQDPAWPGPRPGDTCQIPEALPPDAATAELYGSGSCHVFALAALDGLADHMRPRGLRLILDLDEIAWENDEDPDDVLHAVVHVFAVFDGPDGPVAVDVQGIRPLAQAKADCAERYGTVETAVEDLSDPAAILDFTDTEDDASRPLHAFDRRDFEEARATVARLFRPFTPDDPQP